MDKRSYISEIKTGESVILKGWCYEVRSMAKMAFILLRDSSGIVQCIAKDSSLVKEISSLTLESVVEVHGKVKKADVKADISRKDVEVEIEKLVFLAKADKLPIQVNEKAVVSELPSRLDNRSLDVRKPRISAIFSIQSTIANAFREFFYGKRFIEIQPPAIIATSTEGGTDMFEVKYFENKAYLAQSPQLYKQLMAISLEKVFSTSAVWRAEKHDTSKHINEIRQMDIEVAFANDLEVMKYLEEVVKHITRKVIENNKHELEILKVKLKVPEAKYLKYSEAIALMNKHGIKMKDGDDFEPEAERKLCELFPNCIVFTYEWPLAIKPFYIWPKDGKVSGGFDALYGGIEIASGGQRIHVPELLIKQIKSKGLKPESFKWYIDAFRYGAPMHAGWSIGLERMTQTLLGLDNIREATLFPRDRRRLTP
ncbi:aspartate--tRNA(Asn) ligase [Candidatus Pacearchaeota archaeon]|nr:aspartate--tRNA(Asn) ligase [Candidatus Pacearchaeota archaeon]